MSSKLLLSTILIGLAGCASGPNRIDGTSAAVASASPPPLSVPAPAAPETATPPSLVFFDSRVFDADLSAAMRADKPEIVVDVPVGFNLNQIPERVDRWLYYVKDSGGKVVAEPEIRHRGLFTAVVDVIVMFVGKLDEKAMFGPSERYQAKLVYKENGTVSRIVFNQR